jgi:ABC-type sugar transport system ATPase subunit
VEGPVVLGFRPEALALAADSPARPALEMAVDVVEELGNETLVYGEVPGEIASIEIDPSLPPPLPGSRARVCARLKGLTRFERGAKLPLGLAPDAVHVFDAATGESLGVAAIAVSATA